MLEVYFLKLLKRKSLFHHGQEKEFSWGVNWDRFCAGIEWGAKCFSPGDKKTVPLDRNLPGVYDGLEKCNRIRMRVCKCFRKLKWRNFIFFREQLIFNELHKKWNGELYLRDTSEKKSWKCFSTCSVELEMKLLVCNIAVFAAKTNFGDAITYRTVRCLNINFLKCEKMVNQKKLDVFMHSCFFGLRSKRKWTSSCFTMSVDIIKCPCQFDYRLGVMSTSKMFDFDFVVKSFAYDFQSFNFVYSLKHYSLGNWNI